MDSLQIKDIVESGDTKTCHSNAHDKIFSDFIGLKSGIVYKLASPGKTKTKFKSLVVLNENIHFRG